MYEDLLFADFEYYLIENRKKFPKAYIIDRMDQLVRAYLEMESVRDRQEERLKKWLN